MTAKRWRQYAWVGSIIATAALIIGMLVGDPGWGVDLIVAAVAFVAMAVCLVMESRVKRAAARQSTA